MCGENGRDLYKRAEELQEKCRKFSENHRNNSVRLFQSNCQRNIFTRVLRPRLSLKHSGHRYNKNLNFPPAASPSPREGVRACVNDRSPIERSLLLPQPASRDTPPRRRWMESTSARIVAHRTVNHRISSKQRCRDTKTKNRKS